MKKLSIVICTYKHQDRFSGLKKTILSFSKKENNDLIFEIIVVDNGKSLSESEKNDLLNLNSKIVFVIENRIGLSIARHTGIEKSSGDIIAFTDDDVWVTTYWSENILNIYNNSQVLCAGGEVKMTNIDIIKEKKWISDYFMRFLFPTTFPNETGQILAPYFLIGANMSFRKTTFQEYGLFDERLGRVRNKLLSSEDTEMICRLPKENVFFVKNAQVLGKLDEKRLTKRYMLKRLFWQGYSDYIFVQSVGQNNFYDRNEIFFDLDFIRFSLSKLCRLKFFEFICVIARIIGFNISKNKTENK
jgi:glycosyltransferase involved in cell wall biosynthesis